MRQIAYSNHVNQSLIRFRSQLVKLCDLAEDQTGIIGIGGAACIHISIQLALRINHSLLILSKIAGEEDCILDIHSLVEIDVAEQISLA